MTAFLPTMDDFAHRLASTGSLEAALDVLADEATTLGFDAVDYAVLPDARLVSGGWASRPIFTRNFPCRWEAGWARYGTHDPILPLSYRHGLPVDWHTVQQREPLTSDQRAALAYIEQDMGFGGGVTVPIHLAENRFAFVSGASRLRGRASETVAAHARESLMVLAHTFHHLSSQRFPSGGSGRTRLTARELQCLQFAARGFTAPQTARALCRSMDTVRAHLKSALLKLGARTTAQAVAIATAAGLLESGPGADQAAAGTP